MEGSESVLKIIDPYPGGPKLPDPEHYDLVLRMDTLYVMSNRGIQRGGQSSEENDPERKKEI